MDYKKFLSRREEVVLPYFGGTRLEAEGRRYQITGEIEPGWWRFAVTGREVEMIGRDEPVDLGHRPAVRGHFACGWLFSSGREMEPFALPLEDEPEPFAPCVGRRWFGGDLLFDSIEFEDDAEMATRLALEDGRSLADVKGVSPGLRAAFGFAVAHAAASALGVSLSPREAASHVLAIADQGREGASALVRRIEDERQRHRQEVARRRAEADRLAQMTERERQLADVVRAGNEVRHSRNRRPEARADQALDSAGARMLRCRRAGDNLEVTFQFMGERFISLVTSGSLRVIDSGICLSGTDDRLTLDSLPSAIREAINTGRLHITRR